MRPSHLLRFAVWREALVTSVVPQNEQAANHKASGQTAQQLGPPGVQQNGACEQGGPQGRSQQ